jgi:membrane protease subunit HflK
MTRGAEVVGEPFGWPRNINWRWIVLAVVVVLAGLWVVRGGPAYTVAPDEEALVMTFGQYTRSTGPGLHFKWPWPVQTVIIQNVSEVKRIEVGFRSVISNGATTYRTFSVDSEMLKEARMLTGDENVVDASMAVQYYISDAQAYTFNFMPGTVDGMLRDTAEAALRQAVGDHPIDDVLTGNKIQIEEEIQARMQELAALAQMGVMIDQVKLQDVHPPDRVAQAFKRVASSREERQRIINQAEAYQREKLPQAQGEAERIRLQAQAYRESRVAEADGSVARFKAIAQEYETAPEVTRARLYLEMMEALLPRVKLTVVDSATGVLNLNTLREPVSVPAPLAAGEGEGK